MIGTMFQLALLLLVLLPPPPVAVASTYLDLIPNSDDFLSVNPYFGSSGGTLYILLQTPIADFLPNDFLASIVNYVGFSSAGSIPLSALTLVQYCGQSEFIPSSALSTTSCATSTATTTTGAYTFVILASSVESAPETLKLVTSYPPSVSAVSVPSTENAYKMFGKDSNPNGIVDEIRSSSNAAAVAIVVIIVLLLVLGCCIFVCYRRYKREKERQAGAPQQQQRNREAEAAGRESPTPSSSRPRRVFDTVVQSNRHLQYNSGSPQRNVPTTTNFASVRSSDDSIRNRSENNTQGPRDLSDVQVAVVPRPGETATTIVPAAGSALAQSMQRNQTAPVVAVVPSTSVVVPQQPAPAPVASQSRSLFEANTATTGAETNSQQNEAPSSSQMVQLDLLGY